MSTSELQSIYLSKISEALLRLTACETFLDSYKNSGSPFYFEAAVLQIRKSMECIAFAAVATNKKKYAELRQKNDKSTDYTRDYNAKKILQLLSNINKDFYPIPLSKPIFISPGNWHFEVREYGALTKNRFESFYDRLGKFLHADNPWGVDKNVKNLVKDMPEIISSIRALLSFHVALIRTSEFLGAWVVESPLNGEPPRILTAEADGEFIVSQR